RLIGLREGVALRPEDIAEGCCAQYDDGEHFHAQYSVSRRMRSRKAASCGLILVAISAGGYPVLAGCRRFHIHTMTKVPAMAATKMPKGMIHATSSKPPRMGAASTVAPYLVANHARIALSLAPLATCACNSRIMPGESGQPRWLHSSNIWPQPQAHISWPPTRSYCECTAPSMVTAIATSRTLWTDFAQKIAPRLARNTMPGLALPEFATGNWNALRMARLHQDPIVFHCRGCWACRAYPFFTFRPHSGTLQVWDERDRGSEDHDHYADPDPGDERMQLRANLRLAGVRIAAVEYDVQIAPRCLVQRHHGRGLLMVGAGEVDAALRRKLLDELVAAIDVEQCVVGIVLRR